MRVAGMWGYMALPVPVVDEPDTAWRREVLAQNAKPPHPGGCIERE